MALVQLFIISIGLTVGTLYISWLITVKFQMTLGDYILFGVYIAQLNAPLLLIGRYYRLVQQALMDMRNMLDLLDIPYDVQDSPDATDLVVHNGMIEFDDVCFGYKPERPILKHVTFSVLPGQTVAIVGPSGAGKSTIVRLLFRFYDVGSGSIKIDGTDIAGVTQRSLRRSIGVVPQDTVLFNRDILCNIRYGRITATDREVENAARMAEMHGEHTISENMIRSTVSALSLFLDRIVTFPDGYSTRVGERGLKLSGGEKQRVAIARTLLKAPNVVLLDEATSALGINPPQDSFFARMFIFSLDTLTERQIQAALQKVSEGRTTLMVAHRLSTISHADLIIVLVQGEVAERGTHEELLAINGGIYVSMWNEQLKSYSEADGSTATSRA